jgi:hypothetical protein
MDADDVSMPSRFEKQRTYLIEHNEISIVGCWYEEVNESGKHLSYRKLRTEHEYLRRRYFTRAPFAHPSVMYARTLIEIAGFYPTDTVLIEDKVLWGRALKCGLKIANIPELLFKFRIDGFFYRRRSAIKYGYSFIKTKFVLNKMLGATFYDYFTALGIGIFKSLPSFIVKECYMLI